MARRFENEGNAWEDGRLVELSAKSRMAGESRVVIPLSHDAISRLDMMTSGYSTCRSRGELLSKIIMGLTPEMWIEAQRRHHEANRPAA